ncbi:calcyphosin [Enhydra lutris kenyoni]|uniref:Calcyphosin n=1 Tax=Enhydra lutris kenyoni TaxID=391180 RepID=A0A2Y9LIJ8_ENHLU|nr:calcyphosin [Enhydra lutris kenyoni]
MPMLGRTGRSQSSGCLDSRTVAGQASRQVDKAGSWHRTRAWSAEWESFLELSPGQLPSARPAMDAVDATVEKLRAQCLSRGALGIQGLARFFRRLDRDRSRTLDSGELQRGLAELGLVLDVAEAEGVCRRWDRDGSGLLNLEEFLRALRPPMSPAREAVTAAAFAKLDRSGDGVVTVDDLRGVYSGRAHPKVRSGEWTEEEVLRRFLDNFDSSEKDGQVTLAEFQDYYSGVSTSMDTDEEFVAMMTSAWQL